MSELSGSWVFEIDFLRGQARHAAELAQDGQVVRGTYRTQYDTQAVTGRVADGEVRLNTAVHYQHCGAGYAFSGQVHAAGMEGTLALGEYWTARWRARRVE